MLPVYFDYVQYMCASPTGFHHRVQGGGNKTVNSSLLICTVNFISVLKCAVFGDWKFMVCAGHRVQYQTTEFYQP